MTWAGSALQGRPEIENITVSVLFVMWFGRLSSSASCLCPWPSFFFLFLFPVVHWPDNSNTLECQPPRPTLFIYTPLSCRMSSSINHVDKKGKSQVSNRNKHIHPLGKWSVGSWIRWGLFTVYAHYLWVRQRKKKKKAGLQDIFTLISTWRRRGGASTGAL